VTLRNGGCRQFEEGVEVQAGEGCPSRMSQDQSNGVETSEAAAADHAWQLGPARSSRGDDRGRARVGLGRSRPATFRGAGGAGQWGTQDVVDEPSTNRVSTFSTTSSTPMLRLSVISLSGYAPQPIVTSLAPTGSMGRVLVQAANPRRSSGEGVASDLVSHT
jgi:hypothetical protein